MNSIWRSINITAITMLALVLAFRISDRLARRGGSLPVVPTPNGYDTLLMVAREINLPKGDLIELDAETILLTAERNESAIARLHEALREPTGVPLRVDRGWADQHAEDVKQLKRLAIALGLQSRAKLLAQEPTTNASATCLVDVILLGHALAHGGLVVDGLTGSAIETIGTASLRLQAGQLDAACCRSAAQALERAEARRESPQRILQTEKDWSAASFGIVGRVGECCKAKLNRSATPVL